MIDYTESYSQRDTYKLVEKLTYGNYASELDFLKNLVTEIVKHDDFEIVGGRVWKLNPDTHSYSLKFQYGNVAKIPDEYNLPIEDQPILKELSEKHTALNYESDPVLIEKGIFIYSVTGVGNIIKVGKNKFFNYVLGFNAKEILQSFYETLSIISSVATITLRDLKNQLQHEKIQRDLTKASEIQRNLLPDHYTEFHDYKIFGVCLPDTGGVGGDYFDYLKNLDDEEETLGVLISDAASKGLSAAIQALFVSGAIRMAREFSPKISSLMSRLNTLINETFPYERFVTLFYCELSLSSNRLVLYANAGHCAPLHYRPSIDRFKMLGPTGGLLGIIKHQKFNVENQRMQPGDILVLYTDGINEAQNEKRELYGEQRMMDIIRKHHKESSKDIAYRILEDVQKYSSDSSYTDDKTLVVIKRDEA